jgi:hypothetical protein
VTSINESLEACLGSGASLIGADDFLPLFIWVLQQSVRNGSKRHTPGSPTLQLVCRGILQRVESAEAEAEYMWGLLDPSILNGEV